MTKIIKIREFRKETLDEKILLEPEFLVWDKICELTEVVTGMERWEINENIKCDGIFPGFQNLGEMYEFLLEKTKNNKI